MSSEPLTNLLCSTSKGAFHRATRHNFLKAAGEGQVSKQVLSQWLSQDRLYAHAYVRFIGMLLSKIVLPPRNPDSAKTRAPTTEQRIFDILVAALVNIQRELRFFEDTALTYELDLLMMEEGDEKNKVQAAVFGPLPITRAYIDLFMSAGSPGSSLLEGMTVLFATEYCYLHAWKYAAEVMESSSPRPSEISPASFSVGYERDPDGGALRRGFIPNWSNREFEKFVDDIRDVTDELAGRVKGAEEGEREKGKCVGWWRQVLWLEERFWPKM
jgi:thiaminase